MGGGRVGLRLAASQPPGPLRGPDAMAPTTMLRHLRTSSSMLVSNSDHDDGIGRLDPGCDPRAMNAGRDGFHRGRHRRPWMAGDGGHACGDRGASRRLGWPAAATLVGDDDQRRGFGGPDAAMGAISRGGRRRP